MNEDGRTINETVVAATPVFKRCNVDGVSALYRSACAPDCFESKGERADTLWGIKKVSQAEIDEAAAAGLRLCRQAHYGAGWVRCIK